MEVGLVVEEVHLDLEEVVEVEAGLEVVVEPHLEAEVEDMGLVVVDRVAATYLEAPVAEGWEASPLVHPKRHLSTAALAQAAEGVGALLLGHHP